MSKESEDGSGSLRGSIKTHSEERVCWKLEERKIEKD